MVYKLCKSETILSQYMIQTLDQNAVLVQDAQWALNIKNSDKNKLCSKLTIFAFAI